MTVKTDKAVFNDMFKEFRKEGFIARQDYLCCNSCATSALEADYNVDENSSYVFYHGQDADAFENKMLTRTLYLGWQGNGKKLVEIIKAHGFQVDWDGTEERKIGVKSKGLE